MIYVEPVCPRSVDSSYKKAFEHRTTVLLTVGCINVSQAFLLGTHILKDTNLPTQVNRHYL